MTYYLIKDYKLVGFQRSNTQHKMYDALLQNRKTKSISKVPFGDNRYENYQDKTGLNLYPNLIHGDKNRRRLYRARHLKDLKKGYYSPGHFSFYYLW